MFKVLSLKDKKYFKPVLLILFILILAFIAQAGRILIAKNKLEKIYQEPYSKILKFEKLEFKGLDSLSKLKKVAEALQVLDDFNVSVKIDLSWEDLFSVPEELKSLIGVKAPIILWLQGNNLNKIPEWIGQLKNLKGLKLSDNQIEKVPDSIGQLINLESLDLYHNKIERISDSIGQLKNLKRLNLHHNNLSSDEKEKIKRLLPNTKISF
jgi:hypothetical protein